MHWILLFVERWVVWVAWCAALFAIFFWVVPYVDPTEKRPSSSWFAAMFWPLLPLFSWFDKKGLSQKRRRRNPYAGAGAEFEDASELDRHQKRFRTIREAKDYLAGRIALEAGREGAPLTVVERKMLYFTETAETLRGISEINAEFDRDYDSKEYERKITGLIRNIEAHDAGDAEEQRTWEQAVDKLAEGDNYLSIMLDPSLTPVGETVRPPHDRLNLWLTALGIVFTLIVIGIYGNRLAGLQLRAFLNWLDDHGLLRSVEFLSFLAIVLAWYSLPRLGPAMRRLFDRGDVHTRSR